MNILDFLKQPDVTIIQALLLKFKPVNMDVLPLYIVLMLMFPPMLWLLLRSADGRARRFGRLYVIAWKFGLNLPAYPEGDWYFNPFAWQLLFVFGAWCALGGAERLTVRAQLARHARASPSPISLVAFYIALSWHLPRYEPARAAVARGRDLSDRQDQSRRAALRALPGARRGHGLVHAARPGRR